MKLRSTGNWAEDLANAIGVFMWWGLVAAILVPAMALTIVALVVFR